MSEYDVNIDFDRVAGFYDLYVHTDLDLDFWSEAAGEVPPPRLELMCGTGRITLHLLSRGLAVEGLDYSRGLLDRFETKAAGLGLKSVLHHADARSFDLGGSYNLIFIGFHSISEVLDDADKVRIFQRVRAHLSPEGSFWISSQNPALRKKGLDGEERPIGIYRVPATGEDVEISGRYQLDEGTGLVTGVQSYRCSAEGSPTRRVDLPVRFHLIPPDRLDELLGQAGFKVVRRFGSYDREVFYPDASSFYIVECRKG